MKMLAVSKKCIVFSFMVIFFSLDGFCFAKEAVSDRQDNLTTIQQNRHNEELLKELLPNVRCSFRPTKYEKILMTQLRDKTCSTTQFRESALKLGHLLVEKVVECLTTTSSQIQTPLTKMEGEFLSDPMELISIMRSGDAILDVFMQHFPEASVSKVLIQRDEETAEPQFNYMKLSSTISNGGSVIITEPMIATGGTLEMTIDLLLKKGVKEENILVASICAAPEGLLRLNNKFPKVRVIMTVMDEMLNEKKYIVPGLGDFGDRFFGTPK